MMRKTFIPNWYIDQKKELQNKKIKVCIVVILVLNVVLMSIIFSSSSKLKNINASASNPQNVIKEKVEGVKQSGVIIEKYKEISDFSDQNNINFVNIIITEFEMEIEINALSYDEYITIVKRLEKKYLIKKLVPNTENKEGYNFTVILEV